ncbi:hypothetical protein GINT2_000509 [Glugoides intestinalis]
MNASCSKCKGVANIIINVLKYCNNCFLESFNGKLQKNLSKIPATASIFVFFDDSTSSIIVSEFFEKSFANRPIEKLSFYSRNEIILESVFKNCPMAKAASIIPANSIEEDHPLFKKESSIIKHCLDNSYDILIVNKTLNKLVSTSLEMICYGQGMEAVYNCSVDRVENLKIINIFENIKEKEISYYLFLKKIQCIKRKDIQNQVLSLLDSFSAEVDAKNELALFNVQSTLKKLYKPQIP